MRKILLTLLSVALLVTVASCNKGGGDTPTPGPVIDGIGLKVTFPEFGAPEGSAVKCEWKKNDKLTVVYQKVKYTYKALEDGKTAVFGPSKDDEKIGTIIASEPIAAYFNVNNVNASTLVANFSIPEEQEVGQSTNYVPACAYSATTKSEDNFILLTMTPLAAVLDFSIPASQGWTADMFTLKASSSAALTGFLTGSGLKYNPVTGEINSDEAITSDQVTVYFYGEGKSLSVPVIAGFAKFAGPKEEGGPEFKGAAIYLYNNKVANFSRTLWTDSIMEIIEPKYTLVKLDDIWSTKKAGISSEADLRAFGEEITKSKESLPFGSNFCDVNGVVNINNDIKINGSFPTIGTYDDLGGIRPAFSGTLNGNNHTISGLSQTYSPTAFPIEYTLPNGTKETYYNVCGGLFGATCGTIKNLTVEGTFVIGAPITEKWLYVGGIAGQVCGGVYDNVKAKVNVSNGSGYDGHVRIGGIAGMVKPAAGSVEMKNCSCEGKISLAPGVSTTYELNVGGFTGRTSDGSEGFITTFTECTSNVEVLIDGASKAGGTLIGGFCGFATVSKEKSGSFTKCTNKGKITVQGPAGGGAAVPVEVGGMTGLQRAHDLIECVNEGDIFINTEDGSKVVQTYIGGMSGWHNNIAATDRHIKIQDCVNKGNITIGPKCTHNRQGVGGISGFERTLSDITGCKNYGNITSEVQNNPSQCGQPYIGGICGRCGDALGKDVIDINVENCVNEGTITTGLVSDTSWQLMGGIIGGLYGSASGTPFYCVSVKGCENKGTIKSIWSDVGKTRSGGIVGFMTSGSVENCVNNGIVTLSDGETCTGLKQYIMGGITGFDDGYYSLIQGCTNNGVVTTCLDFPTTANKILLGGILGGGGSDNTIISGCTNKGMLLGNSDISIPAETGVMRGAIICVPSKADKTVVKDCKVGGYLGVNKPGTYEAASKSALTNNESDALYWNKWITCNYDGSHAIVNSINNVFGN